MDATEGKSREYFEKIIKGIFKFIGPKPKVSTKRQMFYKFEDGLYFNEVYFTGGFLMREGILSNIRKYREVNNSTSYELFHYICKIMYHKIKSRVGVIDSTLDVYLEKEDINQGFFEMLKKLDNSCGEYTVYFISNLLVLRDINSVNIGKVSIKNLNEKIIGELASNIEKPVFSNVYSPLALALIEGDYFNPNRFLQEFKGKVIFETVVKGYHLDNEMSEVFNRGLREFKYILSYLSVCKIFLENVASDQFSIKTEDIKTTNYFGTENNYQIYYIKNNNKPETWKTIKTISDLGALPKFAFVIDKNLMKVIKERCELDNFNMIIQKGEYGEIGNKIRRCLDWIYKGMIEKNDTDKAIALFISLETLMSTGPDPLTSLTDDLAENLAIITHNNVEDRLKEKKYFKSKIYTLRNKIMHNGYEINWEDDWGKIERLRIYIAWSVRWFIKNIDAINKIGNDINTLKEYFEREKLK